MRDLIAYVNSFAFKRSSSFWRIFLSGNDESERFLKAFLFSRLDLNRLLSADNFINSSVFRAVLWPELKYLREAVTRREIKRAMRYPKYRDHTCHTLWGFILGCIWFERSPRLRQLLAPHLDDPYEDADALQTFASFWTLAFLCHDIGYLFESDIPGGMTPDPLLDLQAGCAILNDFYLAIFPRHYLGDNIENLEALQRLGYPYFANNSLGVVANQLRKLPLSNKTISDGTTEYQLPSDAFELFTKEECAETISVERAFRQLYSVGLAGQKFLDHGICSGLILMQLMILAYGLWFLVRMPAVNLPQGLIDGVKKAKGYDIPLTIQMMRRRIKWIYAAARHNLDPKWWTNGRFEGDLPFPVDKEKDFPSYFVILMDILQDWDRPRMNWNPDDPDYIMDSSELEIDIIDGRLHLGISDREGARERVDKLRRDLDSRLKEWDELLEFRV